MDCGSAVRGTLSTWTSLPSVTSCAAKASNWGFTAFAVTSSTTSATPVRVPLACMDRQRTAESARRKYFVLVIFTLLKVRNPVPGRFLLFANIVKTPEQANTNIL